MMKKIPILPESLIKPHLESLGAHNGNVRSRTKMKETNESQQEVIQKALFDDDIPKIYANGFAIGLGNADMHIILQRFAQPVAVINISYTLAKTLYQRLGALVTDFESTVERQVLTTDQVDKAYTKDDHNE